MEYMHIFIAILLSFISFCYFFRAKDGLPTNWPFIGMLPALHKNANRVHDFIIEIMEKSQSMTFFIKGPWFSNMNFLVTVDPVNINHVFSRNFQSYGKGPHFLEIFEFLGDGIFIAEDTLWEYHRKLTHSFLTHPKFQSVLIDTVRDEIESSLIPLLDHVSKNAVEIDLQDLFMRLNLDNMCAIFMNHNPKFLSFDFPPMRFSKAVADLEEEILKQHMVPKFIWKSLRLLGVGKEKYKKDCQIVDDFIYMLISKKREERKNTFNNSKDNVEVSCDLLTCIEEEDNNGISTSINTTSDKFLKDTILNLILAGINTTSITMSWFFYLLSKHPHVSTKIREELNTIIAQNKETIDGFLRNFNEYNKKLVYLHAAICEVLRLYPPVAFNHKAAIKSDILPSGHQLSPNMFIIFNMYAMGRMKSIWGDDCGEFKPERWITEHGSVKLEPTNKFLTFGAGPRICQGKDMALTQMKFVIAALILRYDVEVVKGHEVAREISVVLHMKHGLKVKIKRHQY